jgi:hypothetical protein
MVEGIGCEKNLADLGFLSEQLKRDTIFSD